MARIERESSILIDDIEVTSRYIEPPKDEELPEDPSFDPKKTSFSFSRRHGVLIGDQHADGAMVLHKQDISYRSLIEMRRYLGVPVSYRAIADQEFDKLLNSTYASDGGDNMEMMEGLDTDDLNSVAQELGEPEDLLDSEDDAPIIRLINALLSEAIKEGASDIHIEPMESRLLVRFRVDGVLREVLEPKRALAPLISSRIKVMSKLDIAEKRLPQDGRISIKLAGRAVDLRVSTMPGAHGERVVMRLLDKSAGRLDISHLGMDSSNFGKFKELIHRSHGVFLVTGPTGSGKSTTLYAALNDLNSPTKNILTVEDPIEYYMDGIGQTQINAKVDMTFARGLRAILRQDPDVVMIGEIRDVETVEIAIQASLTGHLVLSTLHTNTAVGAVTRLRDMGVEPFLLSSSLLGVVAQRLVRVLCPECRRPRRATQKECLTLGVSTGNPPKIYEPVGCSECSESGYIGRKGIYELVWVDEEMRRLIHEGAGEQAMILHARKHTTSIMEDGVRKILNGETSMEEVLRVTQVD